MFLIVSVGTCQVGAWSQLEGEAAPNDQQEAFAAAAGWAEFERELRSKYAYLDRAGQQAANEQFARSRAVASRAETPEAFRRVLHQTALTFTDPHLIVGPFTDDDFNVVMTSADLDVALRGDRFVVADVRASSAADEAGVRPGWQVVAIDGVPTEEAALVPFGEVLPAPSPRQLAYGATLAANGRRGAPKRRIVFERPDESEATPSLANPRVQARVVDEMPPVTTRRVGAGGTIGWVRFNNSVGDNETITAIRELADTDGLVIDRRNTPSGGNTEVARAVIGHFVDEPRAYQMHTIPFVEREYGVPRRFVEYAMPRAPRYEGPVAVLHGRWTGSMGEGVVIGLDAAADVHTVGSDMGDLLGALWNVDLPASGTRLDLGGEALFSPDGTPREDYVADTPLPSADRDATGGDPALGAALALLTK